MIRRLLLRCLLPAVVLAALPGLAGAQSDRLVVLVRHAEKAAEPAADPPLTSAGEARAARLAAVLAQVGLDKAIATPYHRTRNTALPAARAHGIEVEEIAVAGGLAAHIEAVAAAVRAAAPGSSVLVVGHSNTIPRIVTALGGPALPDLCDPEYAHLFVLTVPDSGPARLVQATYGEPDPPDAASCRQD